MSELQSVTLTLVTLCFEFLLCSPAVTYTDSYSFPHYDVTSVTRIKSPINKAVSGVTHNVTLELLLGEM